MFNDLTPPVLDSGRDPAVHPGLLRLTAEVPEGWAVLKPPDGLHVAMWLVQRVEPDADERFNANLLVQSVPILDNDGTRRAADAVVREVEAGPSMRVHTPRTTVSDHPAVRLDHLAVQTGDADFSVIQNLYLLMMREGDPTLIILTASADTGDKMSALRLQEVCESVVGGLIAQLPAR